MFDCGAPPAPGSSTCSAAPDDAGDGGDGNETLSEKATITGGKCGDADVVGEGDVVGLLERVAVGVAV